jgi:YidC/Oxa1 family membrane protein insertase
MEKRFFLALVLTALVVIATNLLFPPAVRPPAPARGSSATTDTGSHPTTAAVAPLTSAPPPSAGPSNSSGQAINASVATVRTPLVTEKTHYLFSNIGAAPTSAVLNEFASRRTNDGRRVELVRDRDALIRFRLRTATDTIRLDSIPFTVTEDTDAAGRPRLTYAAPTRLGQATIAYTFAPDSYLVHVRGRVEGATEPAYLTVDLPGGLRSEEADTLEDQRHLAYAFKPQRDDARSIAFRLDPGERKVIPGPLTWVAAKNKYFVVGLLTDSTEAPFSELTVTGGPRTSKTPSNASATAVQELRKGAFGFDIYAGPQQWRRLLALGRDFENVNPYGGILHGVVQPFATIVMKILLWMKEATHLNYGWVLVLFGVVVRLILWPLNQSAMRTSLKMQRIQPQLAEIQARHKGDPQKAQAEIMRVYREHGMSPFSTFSGCLPMLIPMPVLFALFFVFQNTIEFRGVPFLWLPDISIKDPYYILPIFMGISMYALSWIGMRGTPPNPQTKMMNYMLPVVMTVLFLNFASGLNLYYAVQNLAALPQQWRIARERAKAGPVPVPVRT